MSHAYFHVDSVAMATTRHERLSNRAPTAKRNHGPHGEQRWKILVLGGSRHSSRTQRSPMLAQKNSSSQVDTAVSLSLVGKLALAKNDQTHGDSRPPDNPGGKFDSAISSRRHAHSRNLQFKWTEGSKHR